MTQAYAIDTSTFVRLLTGHPVETAGPTLDKLRAIHAMGHDLYVSTIVIGEAYIAIQHHYGLQKREVREAMIDVLTSGLLNPIDGHLILKTLSATSAPGLIDRLIEIQGMNEELITLTLDRKMATLPHCRKL
jgi:predicted nucleic acid-binding protein